MSWKISKDGGLDYDAQAALKAKRVREKYLKYIKAMHERHNEAREKLELWKNKRK